MMPEIPVVVIAESSVKCLRRFAISVVALVAVSLATAAPDQSRLQNLTIATLKSVNAAARDRERAARRSDIALSVLLLFIMAAIWTIFSG